MIQLIKKIIFAWKYKRAVKKANNLSKLTGLRYFVIYMNGSLKVVPKMVIKEMVNRHRFRKGVRMADIEKRALFVTK